MSVFVSKKLTSHEFVPLNKSEPYLESCFIEIKLQNKKLCVGSMYRPPNTDDKKFNVLSECMFKKLKSHNCEIIIGTDHNLGFLKNDKHYQTQLFLKNILSNEMIPCITHPTRITKSSTTLIDNIIISRSIFDIQRCGVVLSDISDHFPCVMTWPNAFLKKKSYIEIDFKKIDPKNYHKIKSDLCLDWSQLLSKTNNVDTNFQLFHNKLLSVLDAYTEERCIRVSYKKINKEPWITKGVIALNNKQLKLYKVWLENKDAISYDRYKQYRDKL